MTDEPAFRLAPQEYDPAIPVAGLSEHPRNPNQGDVGAIHSSMTDHGYYGGILVHRTTGHVIRGNHTYRTAVLLGADRVPGFWLDVDDDEAERIMLDDNHAGRLGLDDAGLLAALLVEHAAKPAGLPATYDRDDVAAILASLDPGLPDGFGSLDDNGGGIDTSGPMHVTCPGCGTTFDAKTALADPPP